MMTIGPYTIVKMRDGNFHIFHTLDGEGGIFPAAKVESMIVAFFAQEF